MQRNPGTATACAFRCTRCGNCCTGEPGYVWVNDEEIARHRRRFASEPPAESRSAVYTRQGRRGRTLREKANGDCVFYDRERAAPIYPVRPRQCRTWPFWESNVETPRGLGADRRVCPGAGQGELISAEEITRRLEGNPLVRLAAATPRSAADCPRLRQARETVRRDHRMRPSPPGAGALRRGRSRGRGGRAGVRRQRPLLPVQGVRPHALPQQPRGRRAAGRARPPYEQPVTADFCPFQKDNLCTAREPRPLGCRVYFCDPAYQETGARRSPRSTCAG